MDEVDARSGEDAGVRSSRWRQGLDPNERRRVLAAVRLRFDDGWPFRYGLMLTLSMVVAAMGLSAGSAAVVIGAMLLAPLMTPVMGVGAALAMALPRHLSRSAVVVALSSLGGVGLAYLLASLLPEVPLSEEVLTRTSPDLRDLIVALAAGAAGAYATIRTDVSSALPGVAVAVALVPPLATVGVCLEAGRGDLAGGAALLYVANLVAIVLVATGVFIATGFVPPRRLQQRGLHVAGGGLVVAFATAVIAVPLTIASVAAADDGQDRSRLHAAASAWIAGTSNELDAVRVDGSVVRVSISGPSSPDDVTDLERAVQDVLGPEASLQIRWTQTHEPTTVSTDETGAPGDAQVRSIVESWLRTGGLTGFDIERLEVSDSEVRVDVQAAEPPPSPADLAARLEREAGIGLPVIVNWTRRTALRSVDDGPADTITAVEQRLRLMVQDWVGGHDGFTLDDLAFDGSTVVVTLIGPGPVEVHTLEAQMRTAVGTDVELVMWLTRRERLSSPAVGSTDP